MGNDEGEKKKKNTCNMCKAKPSTYNIFIFFSNQNKGWSLKTLSSSTGDLEVFDLGSLW